MKGDIDVIVRQEPKYEIPVQIPLTPKAGRISQPISQEIKSLRRSVFWANQGDEDSLADIILDFFANENPKIIWSTTWALGITTYILFIYRD